MSDRGGIGAFFDLDGTVIGPPSLEFRLAGHLARRGELRGAAVFSWLKIFFKEGLRALVTGSRASGRFKALDENKFYLTGVREQAAAEWAVEAAAIEIYPDAITRVAWHGEQGHTVFFVSGTLAPLARAVAKQLGQHMEIGVAATEMESVAGRWTGRIEGAAVCGPAKAQAVRKLAECNELDLTRSYAYGDSLSDQWMLATVGNGTVVNPGPRLMWLARRRGWRIVRWPHSPAVIERTPDAAKQRIPRWEKS